jgi:hypothetical protein
LVLLVFLKVFAVVAIVILGWIIRVDPLLEIEGPRCYALGLIVAADCSLLLFQTVLLGFRKLKVSDL